MSAPVTNAIPAWFPPTLHITPARDGAQTAAVVAVAGAWNLRSLEPMIAQLTVALGTSPSDAQWDLSGVTRLDHAGAMML